MLTGCNTGNMRKPRFALLKSVSCSKEKLRDVSTNESKHTKVYSSSELSGESASGTVVCSRREARATREGRGDDTLAARLLYCLNNAPL